MERERAFDEMLDALGHSQRRRLLCALLTHNPQDVRWVAVATDSVDEEHTRLLKMHHLHLPKLEEYGFISWNRDTHEVSKGPNFAELRPLLELLVDYEDELPEGWR